MHSRHQGGVLLAASVKSQVKKNVVFQCSAVFHANSSPGACWLWSKGQGGGEHHENS